MEDVSDRLVLSSVKPNLILILADDMRKDDLEYMPKTKELLGALTFSRAFSPQSQCCPARSCILRGQYTHNHDVRTNNAPSGGFTRFRDLGHEESTIATWLEEAGYLTFLAGKYLNEYHHDHVPPGWCEWYAQYDKGGGATYYDYTLNENGREVHYGSRTEDYFTDVVRDKVLSFIERSQGFAEPLFMYVAPVAPHQPHVPAQRHSGTMDEQVPRVPSFDEADVSDKPGWVRNLGRLSADEERSMDQAYSKRLEMLQAVDEMVEDIVGALESSGRLENTYIFFTSDNGFLLGEHRVKRQKSAPYEESISMPMLIRGPGVTGGEFSGLVSLIDIAPTLADLAGTGTPDFVDGRSLVPILSIQEVEWRDAVLHEFWNADRAPVPKHKAIRTDRYKYVEYEESGSKELYDLQTDPYELENVYSQSDASLIIELQEIFDTLSTQ